MNLRKIFALIFQVFLNLKLKIKKNIERWFYLCNCALTDFFIQNLRNRHSKDAQNNNGIPPKKNINIKNGLFIDRPVKELSTNSGVQEIKPFSHYFNQCNILLLGDPGMGKTFLFKEASQIEQASYLTASNFVVSGKNDYTSKILYIDALDERRSQTERKPSDIDEIVRLLNNEVSAEKIRLSCRTADWLGDIDLEKFNTYFKNHGGYIILELQPLTDNEIDKITEKYNVENNKKICPISFRNEAENKGVASLLRNPQTLVMLIDAVEAHGNWPTTKKELYNICCISLLKEKNKLHILINDHGITEQDLFDAAGAAYASMLISGINDIKINDSHDDAIPFYSQVPFINKQAILLALTSRAFIPLTQEARVTFAHRTIAEFLAAKWLASMISNGLPLKCVQECMGFEQQPAPQLRGLHAWLAIFLKEGDARILIKADPYGVLIYGDAASLSSESRKFLLNALKNLSENDPGFRSQHWASEPFGALLGDDLIEEFKNILALSQEHYQLRSIILDAIENGRPQASLLETLTSVMNNENLPYSERISALESITKIKPNGIAIIVNYIKNCSSYDKSSIRLHNYAICKFYEENFELVQVFNILDCLLTNKNIISVEIQLEIEKLLPLKLLVSTLNFISNHSNFENLVHDSMHSYHIIQLFFELLRRLLTTGEHINTEDLWNWLEKLFKAQRNSGYNYHSQHWRIKDYFSKNKEKLANTFRYAINNYKNYINHYHFTSIFQEATDFSIAENEIIQESILLIQESKQISEKEKFLFKLALSLTLKSNIGNYDFLEILYNLADKNSSLIEIRDSLSSWPIDTLSQLTIDKNSIENKKEQISKKWREDFQKFMNEIQDGTHLTALETIAKVYLACFSDINKDDLPHQRLITIFGSEYAQIALQGLRATIQRSDLPTPETLVSKKEYVCCWDAITAGMDEMWLHNPQISAYPIPLLSSALAIDIVYASNHHPDPQARSWKIAFIQNNPPEAYDVFSKIIYFQLQNDHSYILGLDEVFDNQYFSNYYKQLILDCLKNFKNINLQILKYFLHKAILNFEFHTELSQIVDEFINSKSLLGKEQYTAWLAASFFIDFSKFREIIENNFFQNINIFWIIKEFLERSHSGHQGRKKLLQLANEQIYFLIKMTASYYPNTEHPLGVTCGTKNPWNATEFVNGLIHTLAIGPDKKSGEYLKQLQKSDNYNLSTYQQYLKHATANQLRLRRQNEFKQLSWEKTVKVLGKSEPVDSSTLHAVTIYHLKTIQIEIRQNNVNRWKDCWNEEGGKITTQKREDSCQRLLIELLRNAFNQSAAIDIQPEGHLVAASRTDIVLSLSPNVKLFIELKCDTHPELWKACKEQLEINIQAPETNGYGIYVVFWFGEQRKAKIPSPPEGIVMPNSAAELERSLNFLIDEDKKEKITAIVIDVSPQFSPSKQKKLTRIRNKII